MRSLRSATSPSAMRTYIAPSPSTRASASVRSVRVRRSGSLTRLALLPERRGRGVERAVDAHDVALVDAEPAEPAAERARVRRLHRAEAAIAAAVVARAQCAAAGVGDRPEARRAVRDHHADVAAALALDADAVRRDRRAAAVQERAQDLEQLALVDR